jgi:hypothetical protein
MKIIKAYIQANLYLLTKGMWKGECLFTIKQHGHTTLIATVTGSIFNDTIQIKKTFYEMQVLLHTANEKIHDDYPVLIRTKEREANSLVQRLRQKTDHKDKKKRRL